MLIEKIKQKLNKKKKKYSVLFVHGIASSFEDWDEILMQIAENKYYKMRYNDENEIVHNFDPALDTSTWNVSFYSKKLIKESLFGNLTVYAERLNKMIDLIKKLTKRKKVILISHSMGGLISRKYMTLSKSNLKTVYKILTAGTPHTGVHTSINISGQLKDLKINSKFIKSLNKEWETLKIKNKKLGVIGAIDNKSVLNKIVKDPYKTDSAGPGYIAISSSIPCGEWEEAVKNIDVEFYNTPHFGFRAAVNANHKELLNCEITLKGILWALD